MSFDVLQASIVMGIDYPLQIQLRFVDGAGGNRRSVYCRFPYLLQALRPWSTTNSAMSRVPP